MRALKIVRENELEEVMPLGSIASTAEDLRGSLESLVQQIHITETGFAEWPEEHLDLKIQKQKVIVLHQDLVTSLSKSIELLNRLKDETSPNTPA